MKSYRLLSEDREPFPFANVGQRCGALRQMPGFSCVRSQALGGDVHMGGSCALRQNSHSQLGPSSSRPGNSHKLPQSQRYCPPEAGPSSVAPKSVQHLLAGHSNDL